jgi:small GTP-binding protein
MDSVNNSDMIENGEKVVIIGDASVGKTSLILRYVNNSFSDNVKPTIGCDHYDKDVSVNGSNVKLSIWDTAGQERFRGLSASYYKKARCVIVVFDITKKSTFDKIDFWRDEIANFADPDVLVFLVGNKVDLQDKRAVLKDDAMNYVKKHKFTLYMETSALENAEGQIEKLFSYVAERIQEKLKQEGTTSRTVGQKQGKDKDKDFKLDEEKKEESGGCKC